MVGHFLNLEDVQGEPLEYSIGSLLKGEPMLDSEDVIQEIVEEIEIQATCEHCGKMSLAVLLERPCSCLE